MTLEQVEQELAAIAEQLRPLMRRQEDLNNQLRRMRSEAFIFANSIKRDDVELSSGDSKPWFNTISEFIAWLKTQPMQKRFAEWNERIYFTSDLVSGKMPHDMPATIRELPA